MIITDKKIGDMILEDVRALTAAGKSVDYFTDGRYIVRGEAKVSKTSSEEDMTLNFSENLPVKSVCL